MKEIKLFTAAEIQNFSFKFQFVSAKPVYRGKKDSWHKSAFVLMAREHDQFA